LNTLSQTKFAIYTPKRDEEHPCPLFMEFPLRDFLVPPKQKYVIIAFHASIAGSAHPQLLAEPFFPLRDFGVLKKDSA